MAHTEMQGKDITLLEAIRELEEEMEKLMSLLEISPVPLSQEKQPSEGVIEQRVLDATNKLKTLRRRLAESVRLTDRLIRTIGV